MGLCTYYKASAKPFVTTFTKYRLKAGSVVPPSMCSSFTLSLAVSDLVVPREFESCSQLPLPVGTVIGIETHCLVIAWREMGFITVRSIHTVLHSCLPSSASEAASFMCVVITGLIS